MRLSTIAHSFSSRWMAGAAALTLSGAAPVSAQVIETFSSWNGINALGEFGSGGGDAYGQAFTAPAEYLNSWTYWIQTSPPGLGANVMFTANVVCSDVCLNR